MITKGNKKLVYILNYVNADDSQHYVHVLNLLLKMKELGWSIVLLSEKGGFGTQEVLGHEVRYLSHTGHWSRLLCLAYTLVLLRAQGFRLVFVRITKPAALVCATFGKMLGFRSVYWMSGMILDFDRKKPALQRIKGDLILKIIVRAIDRFVTGPETMIEYYRSAFRLPERKMVLLYNDIDTEKFSPSPRHDCHPTPVQILLLHRLSPARETIRYFPQILHRLGGISPRSHGGIVLKIVGGGSERAELEMTASAAPSNLDIRFYGEVPNKEAKAFYSQADIFIMPSFREGFPRVVIEAMAMGLPIVTTDAGGTRDLLGPLQQDYVVSRDDPGSFADRLAALVADDEMRRRLANENLAHVQRFSTKAVARMYDEELSQLLA